MFWKQYISSNVTAATLYVLQQKAITLLKMFINLNLHPSFIKWYSIHAYMYFKSINLDRGLHPTCTMMIIMVELFIYIFGQIPSSLTWRCLSNDHDFCFKNLNCYCNQLGNLGSVLPDVYCICVFYNFKLKEKITWILVDDTL